MTSLTTIKTLELLEQEMGRAGRKTEEAALRQARTALTRSEPNLLTTGQAARILHVSIPTVKRMVAGEHAHRGSDRGQVALDQRKRRKELGARAGPD